MRKRPKVGHSLLGAPMHLQLTKGLGKALIWLTAALTVTRAGGTGLGCFLKAQLSNWY